MTDTFAKRTAADTTAAKAYEAPKLEVFGEVAALTAAGSGMATEGTNDFTTTKIPMA